MGARKKARSERTSPDTSPDMGPVSDGYHTFDELYEHRHMLFLALMSAAPAIAWFAEAHADGSMFDGWFVAGMDMPGGPITYHLPLTKMPLAELTEARRLPRAPAWEGHTPADVLRRLEEFIEVPY